MSYSVKLTENVVAKLNRYRLSKREVRKIREGLYALTSNPRLLLIRIGPPHDKLQYDLVVTDAGVPAARCSLFIHDPLRSRRRDPFRRRLRTHRRISCSMKGQVEFRRPTCASATNQTATVPGRLFRRREPRFRKIADS